MGFIARLGTGYSRDFHNFRFPGITMPETCFLRVHSTDIALVGMMVKVPCYSRNSLLDSVSAIRRLLISSLVNESLSRAQGAAIIFDRKKAWFRNDAAIARMKAEAGTRLLFNELQMIRYYPSDKMERQLCAVATFGDDPLPRWKYVSSRRVASAYGLPDEFFDIDVCSQESITQSA